MIKIVPLLAIIGVAYAGNVGLIAPAGGVVYSSGPALTQQIITQPQVLRAGQVVTTLGGPQLVRTVAVAQAPVTFAQAPVALAQAPVTLAQAPIALAPAPAVVATRVEPYDPHPRYDFGYSVSDQITGDHKSQYEARDGDVVQGQYSLVEPDGHVRTVQYTSDRVNGFNAQVSNTRNNRVAVAVAQPQVVLAAKGATVLAHH